MTTANLWKTPLKLLEVNTWAGGKDGNQAVNDKKQMDGKT